MDTTQRELIEALARRLGGQRSQVGTASPGSRSTGDLEVLIDLDAPADDLIELDGR